MRYISIIIIVMIFSLGICGCTKKRNVRPIRIQIIDTLTNKPIKGITCIYVLKVYVHKSKLTLLPPLDAGPSVAYIYKTGFISDESGIIDIDDILMEYSQRELGGFREYIFINFDISRNPPKWVVFKGENDRLQHIVSYFDDYCFSYGKKTDKRYIKYNNLFFNPNTLYKGYGLINYSYPFEFKNEAPIVGNFGKINTRKVSGGVSLYYKGENVKLENIVVKLEKY